MTDRPKKFLTVCKAKGCREKMEKLRFPEGKVEVCCCGRCLFHCRGRHPFKKATCEEDLEKIQ